MENGNVVKRISHPVVAVNPNGTVAGYFSSIKEAAVKSGRGRHAISLSCRKGSICKGFNGITKRISGNYTRNNVWMN